MVDDHAGIVERFLDQLTPVDGVVHVGAHEGQEVDAYVARGASLVVLVEPNPDACRVLRERYRDRPEVRVIEAAAFDAERPVKLLVHTSRGGSTEPASVLALGRFKEIVPTLETPTEIEVEAAPLDVLLAREGLEPERFQLLNVDVQGAELHVLRGAERLLAAVSAVLAEVHVVELYAGGADEQAVDACLADRGFRRLDAEYHELYDESGSFPAWGEVLYVRA